MDMNVTINDVRISVYGNAKVSVRDNEEMGHMGVHADTHEDASGPVRITSHDQPLIHIGQLLRATSFPVLKS